MLPRLLNLRRLDFYLKNYNIYFNLRAIKPCFVKNFKNSSNALSFVFLGSGLGLSFYSLHCNLSPLTVKCEPLFEPETTEVDILEITDVIEGKLSYLLHLVLPDVSYLFGAVLTALIAALINVYIPVCIGDVVNIISRCGKNRINFFTEVSIPTAKLCTLYVFQSLSTFMYIGFLGTLGERVACRLRNQLFRKLIYQDFSFFDTQSSGKLIDTISADVQNFKSAFKQCISHGLRSGTQVIGSICSLLFISPTLTATLLGCLPLMFLVGSLMGTELRNISKEARLQNSKAVAVLDESLSHIQTVKSLTMEDWLLGNFANDIEFLRKLNEHLAYGIGAFQGLSNLAMNSVVLGILYVGGQLVSNDQLNSGNLMSFLVTTQTLQRSLTQLSLLYSQVVRGSTSFNHIYEVLNTPDGNDASASVKISKERWDKLFKDLYHSPRLSFSNVSFSYANRPGSTALENINTELPAGKVVALVGESGAGKSTFVSLLERFYNPSKGQIFLNNYNLANVDVGFLRGTLIGYISQNPQIFNATIRENIRFGQPDATDEEVEEAAKMAYAHEFIMRDLPEGYDTVVGQGTGVVAGLSGGQRQRIAIARVFLKNPPILLMDEATSALDAESESHVQAALNLAMKDRTVLIIAHRLSTIRRADWILVMSRGQICEQGTHAQLMARRQLYFNLVQKQEGRDILK